MTVVKVIYSVFAITRESATITWVSPVIWGYVHKIALCETIHENVRIGP